jgi:Ca-activated chloride channel family protein
MEGGAMIEPIRPEIAIIPITGKAGAEGASEMDYLLRLSVPEIEISGKRPLLNLGLVLDRSGSMGGRKLQNAKMAAAYCVDQLQPEDFVSIVIFDDNVEVLVPTVSGNERQRVKEALAAVRSGGSTALFAAWVAGGRQVAEKLAHNYVNRVILMTDGLANVGETNPEFLVNRAAGLFARGIATTTIGVGNDFNEDLLVAMAGAAGGNSWYVEGPGDFQRIFTTEMGNLLREVSSRVSLGLEPGGGVIILDVLNDFDRTSTGKFRLPNLLAGESLDIIVRVLLPGGPSGRAPVFKATVGWVNQGSEERRYAAAEAGITYVPADEAKAQENHQEVVKARQLLGSARARRQAMAEMDAGDIVAAQEILEVWSGSSQALARKLSAPELAQDSRELTQISEDLQNREEAGKARKKMMYQRYYRSTGKKNVPK